MNDIKKSALLFFIFINLLYAQNPGDRVFSDLHIFEIHFHFNQTDYLDSLHKSHDTGEYIPGDIIIDGVHYDNVGVRFKGHSSYLFYPGNKKPFRIKFNKFKDLSFDGLKKINLNNGWGDPTMIREKLHLDFLINQGVPAPRANFAKVYIDSVYWGFYSLVEHVDKVFLQSWFDDDDGNLYKAEKSTLEWKGADQTVYYDDMELKTNEKENDWSDLVRFLDVLNNTSKDDFQHSIETVFNPDPYIRAWAVDNLFINLDSYLGSATNYYLYNNPFISKFEWIAWDVNLSLAARNGSSDLDLLYAIPQRPLMIRLLSIEKYKNRYLELMQDYVLHYFSPESLFPKIDQLSAFIREDYQADTQKMYTNDEIIKAIDQKVHGAPGLKTFISERRMNVLSQLDSLNIAMAIIDHSRKFQPKLLQVYPNIPNPFNSQTLINYNLQIPTNVELNVYNVLGQKVTQLFSGQQQSGYYQFLWDARDMPSGIYYAVIKVGNSQAAQKMILSK